MVNTGRDCILKVTVPVGKRAKIIIRSADQPQADFFVVNWSYFFKANFSFTCNRYFVIVSSTFVFPLIFHFNSRQEQNPIVVSDNSISGNIGIFPGPIVVRNRISKSNTFQSDILSSNRSFRKSFGKILWKT